MSIRQGNDEEYGDGKPKKEGTWDWFGACSPDVDYSYTLMETFSVGIFQWKAKSGGKGTKRGKVIYRIRGSREFPHDVYKKATEKVEQLNVRSQ